MATVTLKLKIDIPGLEAELNQAIKKILDTLEPLKKLGINIDDKEALAQLQAITEEVKTTGKGADETREKFSQWGMIITGLNQGFQMVQEVVEKFKESIMSGAELQTLRANFRGTTEDLDLFRKATAGTVSDGNLIKLSNQATALGVSMDQQAILFSLARKASNEYGGDVVAGFNKVVMASEGSVKGLSKLGIQKSEYNQILKSLSEATGQELKDMDFEDQKHLRLQAILQASKISMDDIVKTTQNSKEKWESLGVTIEESKTKFGLFLSDALMPLIDGLKSTGPAGDILVGSLTAIAANILPVLPLLIQMKVSMNLLKLESINAAAGVDAVAFSTKALLGIIAGGVILGYGLGKLIDYIRDKQREANEDTTAFDNIQKQLADQNKNITGDFRFVPGEGWTKFVGEEKEASDTVSKIQEKIAKLNKDLEKTIPKSDEWLKIHKDILTLQADIEYKPIKPKVDKTEIVETVDKLGELKEKALSQNRELLEKSQLLDAEEIKNVQTREMTKAKITFLYQTNEINRQIQTLQVKGVLSEDEVTELANLNIKKENIQKEYNNKVVDFDKKRVEEQKKIEAALKDLDIEQLNAELEIDKDNLSKKLQLLEMEKQKRLDVATLTNQERQKIEELFSQKRTNLIQSEIESLSQEYEKHFQFLFQSLQSSFQQQEQTSDAELKLNEVQYKKQQDDLKTSLQNNQITKEEYDLQYQVNYEQHQKYLDKVDKERQSFISKLGGDIQKYLLQQLTDYLTHYLATKLAESTIFSTTETVKTAALGVSTLAQVGISTGAAAAATATTVGSMAAIAAAAAPAAALTSIASFGIGTAVAIAGVIAGVAAIVALLGGFEEGGYTGKGNKKQPAGIVHKGEHVFENDIVEGQENEFSTLHQLLRSGMSLSQIFTSVAKQANPILQPHEFLRNVNLSIPSGSGSSTNLMSGDEMKSLLTEVRDELKEIKEKGMKLELEAFKLDEETRGENIYKSYEIRKKFENKRMTGT